MNEYLLAIYRDLTSKNPNPSPQQMRETSKPFQDWVSFLYAEGKLKKPPKNYDTDGRYIRSDHTWNGPFEQGNVSIGGMFVVKADSYEEAVEIGKGCPILEYGAIVELRKILPATL